MPRRFPALSRRKLLQSLGLGAALSPLLPILNATGQEALVPKRLLLVFTPDGAAALDWGTVLNWKPQGSGSDFTFHPMHQPLDPFKAKINVPWGLTMSAGGAGEAHAYGMAGIWTGSSLHEPHEGADFDGGNGHRTGWGSGPSIDQIVASSFGANMPYSVAPDAAAQETAYRTVELGVQCGEPHSVARMIYKADKQPIHPETNPRAAFDRLFANVTESGDAPVTMVDPAVTQTNAEHGAIIDQLQDDLSRIRTRIGSQEYIKLDAHLEGLLALERRLTTTPTATATLGCTIPEAPPESSGGNRGDFPGQITQMMDVVTHALACDVTRVASLQLSAGFSNVTHSWLGQNTGHHSMSHDGDDRRAELEAIDTWYAQQFAYLLQQLDSVAEGNGTLLDNTLVVWGRELGSTAHRMENVPLIMAGSARGGLVTGRTHDFGEQDHAGLLVSIAQLMGIETNTIGNVAPNSGALSGLV